MKKGIITTTIAMSMLLYGFTTMCGVELYQPSGNASNMKFDWSEGNPTGQYTIQIRTAAGTLIVDQVVWESEYHTSLPGFDNYEWRIKCVEDWSTWHSFSI